MSTIVRSIRGHLDAATSPTDLSSLYAAVAAVTAAAETTVSLTVGTTSNAYFTLPGVASESDGVD